MQLHNLQERYTEDYFYSSFSGELKQASSSYYAKIDNGEFVKYEFVDNNVLEGKTYYYLIEDMAVIQGGRS